MRVPGIVLAAAIAAAAWVSESRAQPASADGPVGAVVRIKTFIAPDGQSVGNLGRQREGSGVVIDDSGLILTIGYLMLEAHAAEVETAAGRTLPANVVGYDHASGFGLLRTLEPPNVRPMPLGRAADVKPGDRALVASFGGLSMVGAVEIVAKREFAGSWEYLLDEAIFTVPPHPAWSGAALIGRDGRLIGIGSLVVGNAEGGLLPSPGNMFVPVDLLPPILGDLLADGKSSAPPRPWLGVNADERGGRLLVGRVTPGSPAEKAGIRRGDVIVGVGGEETPTLAEFYRKLWARGAAGVSVPLDVEQPGGRRRMDVPSANRMDHLKLKSTF